VVGKLEEKIAVITGATSGMGLATAKLFVDEGAYVFITGCRQEQLDAAVKEIGKNLTRAGRCWRSSRPRPAVRLGQGEEGPYQHSVRQCRFRRIQCASRFDY
jgi:NAD(P)-dependent dehydrogenase (short-subunit alcohol dehydrogenase family)